ncbi:UDP-N-acetylmuramoyl-L-alanine--D-glutamate ligase [Anaplasma capra]|uniref:UDP-N-acetylmuramoyl-L-alanine--D-glutamate ligase n=1 Tax=Anaplasma capra TaxID=1562740 RepID=UPI0021D5C495|nr:UDP-N-acetylmuramoyl-L-alanine--D-glutamate ligase [Anaplasma capra]MCU7611851.1 UDP-N-acetylmuramoyl-L-alanine--D-glutamate ligase [Anaplasma capra]MCU7612673.1 UDP-N-acetylmuramoyl-L-alanine--D-glutamate ligase [Anaplasma capra]
MILLQRYCGKKVAVFGLGETGISAVRSLVQSGAQVFVWDDDELALRRGAELDLGCRFLHPYERDWADISELVLSPGVPHSCRNKHWVVKLAMNRGCRITSDVEIFCRSQRARIVGVTGTNGKSTTVELIGWILNRAGIDAETGGNVGRGVLSLTQGRGTYVLELSSYQLALLRDISLDIGVILNVTPDHLDVHSSMADYVAAKGRILNFSSLVIANCGDRNTEALCRHIGKKKLEFSCKTRLDEGVSFLGGHIHFCGKVIEIGDLRIDKTSNAENIAAAYAVTKSFGVKDEVILASIAEFTGLRHRNQIVTKIANVTFVNDSKATNAASAEKALIGRRNVYWIVGGKSKDGGIDSLLSLYSDRISKAFLVGESTSKFALSMRKAGIAHVECHDVCDAVQVAFAEAVASKSEATVLLSPACSSLDQWKNFEERGEAFCTAVHSITESASCSV